MTSLDRRDFLRTGTGALGAAAVTGLPRLPAGPARPVSPARPGRARLTRAQLDNPPVEDLRRRLTGRLLLPADGGYDAATQPANGRFSGTRPVAVVLCATVGDIVACVNWAREFGVRPVARNGGHSYAGFSTTTGLLIDVGALNSVIVDESGGTATVGGGALNGDLFAATIGGPFFLPVGTCLGVGVGGLTLGGGIGYTTHSAGLTCDHLRASEIITAAGDQLELTAARHSDLFWACRGGAGGSFGINTSFTFDLHPVPRAPVTYYRFDYRGADAAAAVLTTFHEVLAGAPAAFNGVAMAQATPVGAGGPREAIDVFTRGQYLGPASELRDIVAPLRKLRGLTAATVTSMPFWDAQRIFASDEAPVHSFGDISRYAPAPIPSRTVQQVVDLLARCPSRTDDANGAFWSLGWIGGDVVNSVGRTQTAYVHRDMLTLLRPTPVWPDDAPPSVGRGLIAWTSEMVDIIAPVTAAESYQNFPNRLIRDWQREYYAENFPRLVRVKSRYDPANLFRNEQSIPPAAMIPGKSAAPRPSASPRTSVTLA
jgi:FAD/FMN-containing dehydrogenase